MKLSQQVKAVLFGAIVAVPLFSGEAQAQYRVGDDGRALDANNRIGSGGYNTGGIPYWSVVQGNRIVTGNVTQGREFRGGTTGGFVNGVPIQTSSGVYQDPLEFRGNVARLDTERFIRNSYGVSNGVAGQLPNQPQVFYGSALATPPPPGAFQQGFTGTYVGAQVPPYTLSSPFIPQMGTRFDATQQITLPRPGELIMPGPLDPQTNRPTMLSASPLLGVRQYTEQDLENGLLAPQGAWRQGPSDRLRLDNGTIQRMQEELRRSSGIDDSTDNADANEGANQANNGNLARPLGRPVDAPEVGPLTPRPLDNAVATTALPNTVRQESSIENRLLTPVPPALQSTQLAEMERRLSGYYSQRFRTDEERNREFLRQLRAREEADRVAQGNQGDARNPAMPRLPGGDRPDYREMSRELLEASRRREARPGEAEKQPDREKTPRRPGQQQPGVGIVPPTPLAEQPFLRPQPVQVASLAEGIKAEGLRKVMQSAEGLMRQGKFVSALEQYGVAEEVAPNNPLVWLGSAHAELGAGYYLRAADHLRRALASEPTLLMGQYDLKGMIGQDRLTALVKDLKETANSQEQNHGLVFLLSYLAYNTNNETQAGVYLDLAQKRAGGRDDFYRLVRLHWNLPGGDVATGPEGTAMPLGDVLKQLEAGNVESATITSGRISGEFRKPVEAAGAAEGIKLFRADLPTGAAAGPLGKWIMENANGAKVINEYAPGGDATK